MKYSIPKRDNRDLLDDSIVKQTLNNIENLIGKKLDVNITTQTELSNFLNTPKNFTKDENIINNIKDLKDLIIEMSDVYHA